MPDVDLLVLEASKGRNPAYIEEVKKQWGSRCKRFLQAYTDGALEPQTGKVGSDWGIPELKVVKSFGVNEGVSILQNVWPPWG